MENRCCLHCMYLSMVESTSQRASNLKHPQYCWIFVLKKKMGKVLHGLTFGLANKKSKWKKNSKCTRRNQRQTNTVIQNLKKKPKDFDRIFKNASGDFVALSKIIFSKYLQRSLFWWCFRFFAVYSSLFFALFVSIHASKLRIKWNEQKSYNYHFTY